MMILEGVLRLLVGANFLVFGLNGFFHWFPIPPAAPRMAAFVKALDQTGYLLTVVKILEILAGALILAGIFLPLALTLLAPIVFVLVSSQLVLNEKRGWGISIFTAVPYLALVALRWEAWSTLFLM